MVPTFADVFSSARKLIGDTETTGGAVATDSMLLEYGQRGYEAMYGVLKNIESPRIRRTVYWRVLGFTSYLHPSQFATLGLPAMGEPINIWDRREGQMIPIDLLTPYDQGPGDLNPYVDIQAAGITTSAPNLSDGSMIDITGCNLLTSDINDEWCIMRTEIDTIRLVGCAAVIRDPIPPTHASSGFILSSSETWPADPIPRGLNQRDLKATVAGTTDAADSRITRWCWNDGAFRFRPCAGPRHLRIEYRISPDPPSLTTTSLGVQDSLNFLAAYTAALFLDAKGAKGAAASKFMLACGDPAGELGNGARGYIGQLTKQHVKSEQMVRLIIPRFRPRRSTAAYIPY